MPPIFKNKNVTVVGIGKSGFAAAKFLLEQKARVRVTEGSQKKEALENASYLKALGAEVETGGHTEAFIAGSDWVITSPGVPKNSLPLAAASRLGIPVISEVELAFLFCKGKVLAVTGSNGKTTTSHLIHRILTDSGHKSVLCGNVGYSFLEAIAAVDKKTDVVLELSSFQLEDSPTLKPHIAVILNVSPNHLDRHKTMENYVLAKEKIFHNQDSKDYLILNYDNSRVREMSGRAKSRIVFFSKNEKVDGVFLRDGFVIWREGKKERKLFQWQAFPLQGEHNVENMLAATAVAYLRGLHPQKIAATLLDFKTLEHRIEPLGSIGGVLFVNDSKSTTVASTQAAISAVASPMVLIAGGRDKGADFSQVEGLLEKKAKAAVLYGEAGEKIAGAWKTFKHFSIEKNFKAAVERAFSLAESGDTILLSPMCTSFDQFSSFEHRGEVFKEIFLELEAKPAKKVESWSR